MGELDIRLKGIKIDLGAGFLSTPQDKEDVDPKDLT